MPIETRVRFPGVSICIGGCYQLVSRAESKASGLRNIVAAEAPALAALRTTIFRSWGDVGVGIATTGHG